MSTNGTFGFVIDGTSWAGFAGRWPRALTFSRIRRAPCGWSTWTPNRPPRTSKQLKRFYNPYVGGPSDRPTWYQLLRETQGDPDAILTAGVVEDGSVYVGIEYAYLVDFDKREFVASDPFDASLGTWSFDALPSTDEFLAAFGERDA